MAKTKKKKNYRLRKSVRRTLGALFMISAIIVAAIPFPDAAATNGETLPSGNQPSLISDDDDDAKLIYGGAASDTDGDGIGEVEDEELTPMNIPAAEEDPNNPGEYKNRKKSYKLVNNKGVYTYLWQYMYYIKSPREAILTDYNRNYTVANVILDDYVNSANYLYVLATDIQSKVDAKQIVVNINDFKHMTDNYNEFLYYASTGTIEQFEEACGDYEALLSKYEEEKKAAGGTLDSNLEDYYEEKFEEAETRISNLGTIKGSSLSLSQKCVYYLENIGEYVDVADPILLKKEDFSFFSAIKPQDNTDDSDAIYLVKQENPNAEIIGYIPDSDKLMYNLLKGTAELVGIGPGAFSNVQTGVTLTLPDGIKYIADEAFMNSYVSTITLSKVLEIGNRAFKDSKLESITWVGSESTTKIGSEAFANTFITDIKLPQYLNRIGNGAFANCKLLNNIQFHDKIQNLSIGQYAFYNCIKLNSLDLEKRNIIEIEEGSFSISLAPEAPFTSFKFPNTLQKGENLGDFIFAGRENLETVVMPSNLGLNTDEALKDNIFLNCLKLKCVEFPETCREVTFGSTLFRDVENSQFYVKGPQFGLNSKPAGPRQSTWDCKMNVSAVSEGIAVPYMYKDANGNEFYEICDGTYVKLVDGNGILQSCIFREEPKLGEEDYQNVPFTLDGTVGNRTIVGIADNCFSEDFLKHVVSVTINDDVAIKTIGKNAFANAPVLETVDIGDLVESIGDEAFKDCKALTKVTLGTGINSIGARAFQGCSALTEIEFEKPTNTTDYESFAKKFPISNIGTDAFALNNKETSGTKLIIKGVIHPEYGPWVWAMDPENFVNRTMGIRVCYKSGAPEYQTVILDNQTNYPTLVDYLHYSDLANITTTYKPSIQTTDTDDSNSDELLPTDLKTKYENYRDQLTMLETFTVAAALDLKIPAGIESIDVRGFITDHIYDDFEDESLPYCALGNSANVATYLGAKELDNNIGKKMSTDGTSINGSYYNFGLFNGDYEGSIGDAIGNDMLETVTMYTVKYLPNNDTSISDDILSQKNIKLSGGAFYDCDNLQTVDLGSELENVGELPFLGCHKLNHIEGGITNSDGTKKYECKNKILYENLDDGSNTKKIIQCLGSRGDGQDSKIDTTTDNYLTNVSSIAEGAFSNCPNLKIVDFRGNSTLKELPAKAFYDSDNLTRVDLPENMRTIGQFSFSEIGSRPNIYIYGKEVSLANNAFDGILGKKTDATVHTYKDSSAYNTAEDILGSEGGVETLPEGTPIYEVKFFDYDFKTQIGTTRKVEHGKFTSEPNRPSRDGYTFKGWSNTEWLDDGKNTTGVTRNLDVYAMYEPNTSNSGSSNSGSSNSGSSNSGSSNSGSSNSDGTIKGDYVDGGIDTNGDGIPDVDEKGNKLYKLTVTNGEGSGYYKAGKTVNIKAGIAPKGTSFAYWSCSNNNLIFQDHTDWITTLTMVAEDVTVICNFDGQYRLEVEYGTGSGSYPAGAKVAISALEAPQGRQFASWTTQTNGLNIEDSTKATTIITMPQGNALITATYMDTPKTNVSGNSTSSSKNNTSVVITKPGISDKNSASAYVSGSSDNFVVKISESLDAADEVQRALQKKYPDMSRIKYFAMDITLYDAKGENKITNTDGLKVNITMPIPDALREYAGNNRVGAVKNGELETLNPKFTTINGVPSVTFTATHFSPYTIYVDTANLTAAGTLDSTPKTGDGIHPKWFLSLGLACISIILFTKRDKKYVVKA